MKSVLTQAASRTDFSMVFCHGKLDGRVGANCRYIFSWSNFDWQRQLITSPLIFYSPIYFTLFQADVKGAFMNDNIQCREGLEASDFVPHIPTYTGHFHKPHTVSAAFKL